MNPKLLLLFIIIAGFSSCSSAYKTGQTPDDVYYSPAPPQNNYVQQTTEQDKTVYSSSYEDIDLRLRVDNRRWRRYDDYGYYPYDYRYGFDYPIYVDPKYGVPVNKYNQPRKFNLGSYKPTDNTTVTDLKSGKQNTTTNTTNVPVRTFKTDNSNSGVSNFIRKIFSGNGNNTSTRTTDNTNTRTFDNTRNSSNNSGSNSSSGSSKSSTNAPVRTFGK